MKPKTMIPQRPFFAKAELLGPAFTLVKDRRTARCQVWSHQFGNELRLMIDGDDMPRTQVCATEEDFARTVADWREALEANGWARS